MKSTMMKTNWYESDWWATFRPEVKEDVVHICGIFWLLSIWTLSYILGIPHLMSLVGGRMPSHYEVRMVETKILFLSLPGR